MDHAVRREHRGAEALQRVKRGRLPGPDPAGQTDERDRQAGSSPGSSAAGGSAAASAASASS
ncbi:MAG TPA: hypothetical protein VMP89_16455, partial [Solirubrobacteraceae bacterium]|nr:hypothetical protein [Solirubrobacteraceae bacterium]